MIHMATWWTNSYLEAEYHLKHAHSTVGLFAVDIFTAIGDFIKKIAPSYIAHGNFASSSVIQWYPLTCEYIPIGMGESVDI